MKKNIFIYWDSKFINAPFIVKKCLLSWKKKNPTWKIIELNNENLHRYINIENEIPNIRKKKIQKCHYADIIRVFLLQKHGGCWCDATTFCNQSLDEWLYKYISSGFFAFDKPGPDRLLSNWFLYSEPNTYIINHWKKEIVNYWKNNNKIDHYYRHHYIFGDLYVSDDNFKSKWNQTPKISADGPHIFHKEDFSKPLSKKIKMHVDSIKSPMYKLSYKSQIRNFRINSNCNLDYLLDKLLV